MTNAGHEIHAEGVRCQACIDDAVAAERHRLTMEHERWKRDFTVKAWAAADEHNLCSDFDDFMTSVGLEPRSTEYVVTVRVLEVHIDIDVEAHSKESAVENIDTDEIIEALRDGALEYRVVRAERQDRI